MPKLQCWHRGEAVLRAGLEALCSLPFLIHFHLASAFQLAVLQNAVGEK